jgi:uncharacterized protein with HEPN domain
MLSEDMIRLSHMRDAATEALSFIADKSRANLETDRMLVLALVKSIEIIGEAAARVSRQTKSQWTEIPWRDVISMRKRLITLILTWIWTSFGRQ